MSVVIIFCIVQERDSKLKTNKADFLFEYGSYEIPTTITIFLLLDDDAVYRKFISTFATLNVSCRRVLL